MAVTNADNQGDTLKNKIRKIYKMTNQEESNCAIRQVLAPTVDKWSIFCLYNLAYNDLLRFNELKKYIPSISSRMLSVTLKKLEEAKLVNRKVYAEVPPKVEYSLTPFGTAYAKKLVDLNLWLVDYS